jgi:ABC-type sugar transport system substrate-binding protein
MKPGKWPSLGRTFFVLVTALAIIGGLAACGGSGGDSTSAGAETASTGESTSPETSSAFPPESGGIGWAETGEGNAELTESALVETVSEDAVNKALDNTYGVKSEATKTSPGWVRDAFSIALQKISPEQEAFVMECITGTSCSRNEGELSIAFVDGFGANSFRRQSRVNFVYALSRYPQVKEVIYSEAGGDLQTLQSNIRSAISQGVSAIVGNFDPGDAVLPQIREARAAGIPVISVQQSPPSAKYDGTDVNWFVGTNLCEFGNNFGTTAAESAPSAKVAMYTGIPGNPFAAKWQPCAEKAVEEGGGSITTTGNTNWSQQGNAQAASALLAEGAPPNAIMYDEDTVDFATKFIAAGQTVPEMVCYIYQGSYELWKEQQEKGNKYEIYGVASANSNTWLAAYLAVGGATELTPPDLSEGLLEEPTSMLDGNELGEQYVAGAGTTAAFGSNLPENLLIAAQKAK